MFKLFLLPLQALYSMLIKSYFFIRGKVLLAVLSNFNYVNGKNANYLMNFCNLIVRSSIDFKTCIVENLINYFI